MKRLSLGLVALALTAGASAAQTPPQPSEWRRTEGAPTVRMAVAFTPAVDGRQRATVVLRNIDPPSAERPVRGLVMEAEVRCDVRRWRIVMMSYHAEDYSVLNRIGEVPDAPLVRETPLHAAITDVCDGGHTGPVELTTTDTIAVQRWLARP